MTSIRALSTIGLFALIVSTITYVYVKFYNARMLARRYHEQGHLVAPNHYFFFGHIVYLKTWLETRLPAKAYYRYALCDIALDLFAKEGCYYINCWPRVGLIMVNISLFISPYVF